MRSELQALLATSSAAARDFEQSVLDSQLAGDWKRNLVIFGASALGLKALRGLQACSIQPLAFADNNADKYSARFGGLRVLSPAEALSEFGCQCSFIVCVWRSTAVMEQLKALGCTSAVEFKALFWSMPDQFLPHMRVNRPHLILEEAGRIREVFELLSDTESRREFVDQIRWLLAYEFAELPSQDRHQQYFDDLFAHHPAEVLVDCGAYTGDTLAQFLKRWSSFRAMHAFEPEPSNLKGLEKWAVEQPVAVQQRLAIHPFAVSDSKKVLNFASDGVGSSECEDGQLRIQAVKLDEQLKHEPITFIKMDIEGGEPDALVGAEQLIRDCRPVLAICLYHRQEHLYQIPHLVSGYVKNYAYFIRRYGDQFGDLVCYAVPNERVSGGPNVQLSD